MKKDIIATIAIKAVIGLLFYFAIGHQPYSYYQLIKFVGFLGFAILTWIYYVRKNIVEAIVAALGAIFFNPFYKVTFTRDTWQEIDLYIFVICSVWIMGDVVKLIFSRRKKGKWND